MATGLKKFFPDVRFSGNQATPDELDRYESYIVAYPGTSLTYVGTCAAGTNAQAKPLVLINANLDYPRNLRYSVVGTNDVGGTWTVNGKDQFGAAISETVGSGTVAQGTPAFDTAGTKIFALVSSGTFTFAAGSAGSGSAQLGVAYGGTAGTTAYFGLPTKIAAVSDVKRITIVKNNVNTTLGGGTISSTVVGTTNHTFNGTAVLGTADMFIVTLKSTYNAESDSIPLANL